MIERFRAAAPAFAAVGVRERVHGRKGQGARHRLALRAARRRERQGRADHRGWDRHHRPQASRGRPPAPAGLRERGRGHDPELHRRHRPRRDGRPVRREPGVLRRRSAGRSRSSAGRRSSRSWRARTSSWPGWRSREPRTASHRSSASRAGSPATGASSPSRGPRRPSSTSGECPACCSRGADVSERKRQEEEVRASRKRIVDATDAARRRLERNLHDGAQQRLAALSLSLRLAESRLETDVAEAAEILTRAREELARALEELRELARGLHPNVLTDRGLGPALEALVIRSPFPVEVAVPEQRLPPAHRGGRVLRRRRGARQRREVRARQLRPGGRVRVRRG